VISENPLLLLMLKQLLDVSISGKAAVKSDSGIS
jgi:hypothetical protein